MPSYLGKSIFWNFVGGIVVVLAGAVVVVGGTVVGRWTILFQALDGLEVVLGLGSEDGDGS